MLVKRFMAWCLGLAKGEIRIIDNNNNICFRRTVHITTKRIGSKLYVVPLETVSWIATSEVKTMFIEAEIASDKTYYEPLIRRLAPFDTLVVDIKNEIKPSG